MSKMITCKKNWFIVLTQICLVLVSCQKEEKSNWEIDGFKNDDKVSCCSDNANLYLELYKNLHYFLKIYSFAESRCLSLKSPLWLIRKREGFSNVALQRKDDKVFFSAKQECIELTNAQIELYDELSFQVGLLEESHRNSTKLSQTEVILWDGKDVHFYINYSGEEKIEVENLKKFSHSIESALEINK